MEGREREEEPSLPPGYVSLAQLQQRRLKRQQEEKLREKQEEEKKNGGRGEMGDWSVRDVIEERGKGKEVVIGGLGNGEENTKGNLKKNRSRRTKKKPNNRHSIKGEFAGDKGKGKDELEEENIKTLDGEWKGIEEIQTVAMVKALPSNEVKGEIRGGLVKNGNKRRPFHSRKVYEGRFNELNRNEGALALGKKMEVEKGYGKNWRQRGIRDGEYREKIKGFKESRKDVSKGDATEGGRRNGELGDKDNLFEESGEDVSKCNSKERGRINGEFGDRYNGFKESRGDVSKGNATERGGKGGEYGERYNGFEESRQDVSIGNAMGRGRKNSGEFGERFKESREDVTKGNATERGRKNGECGERYNWFKESREDGSAMETELEKKGEDEILEIFDEKCGVSGADRSGRRRQIAKGRAEGNSLNDDTVALEKKLDDEVLVVERAGNGEKGYRSYGNWRRNVGEDRRYTGFRRSEHRSRMNQRESRKVWVKKDEKLGADAAEVGS